MKICIPIEENKGLDSLVCAHFGSSPCFMIVETKDNSFHVRENLNAHHSHGMCQPLASISGENLDAMIVGGIGQGAVNKLRNANIKVYLSQYDTVSENIEAIKSSKLCEVTPQTACAHHGAGDGQCHS